MSNPRDFSKVRHPLTLRQDPYVMRKKEKWEPAIAATPGRSLSKGEIEAIAEARSQKGRNP